MLPGPADAAPPGGRQVALRRGRGAAEERRQGQRARQRRTDCAAPLRQGRQCPGLQVGLQIGFECYEQVESIFI